MEIERQLKKISELEIGMYVCDLDRPWLETPFLMQGFLIECKQDIRDIGNYCDHVFIDIVKSKMQLAGVKHAATPSTAKPHIHSAHATRAVANNPSFAVTNPKKAHLAGLLTGRQVRHYKDSVEWKSELVDAKKAIQGLTAAIRTIFDDLQQGRELQIAKLKQSVSPLVHSIERNPDACIWLSRLKNQDSYIYKHSIATSVWAVAFGRELGLPPQDLKSLALGALLLDVGKLEIPRELLNKKGLISEEELNVLRNHVKHSVEALRKSATNNRDIWDMVAHHHERINGSGYPGKLKGADIPLFAQIAGIVDTYDAMTSERPYTQAISPSSAIKYLYHARGKEFDEVLVEEFIQAVGLYPAGTLVLLSTGEVAIVIAEGRTRRLKPQVLVLLDAEKNHLNNIKILNLLNAVHGPDEKPVEILQSLEPSSYGIDTESIQFDPQNYQQKSQSETSNSR